MTRFLPILKLSVASALLLLTACGSLLVIQYRDVESLDQYPEESVVIESRLREHPFQMWVADTQPRRTQGLMSVKKLDTNRGMLFLFDSPTRAAMWMKNMAIPIDMLFIAPDGRVLSVERNANPSSLQTIQATAPVSGVIELPGGTVARLNLKTGDIVRHRHFAGLAR